MHGSSRRLTITSLIALATLVPLVFAGVLLLTLSIGTVRRASAYLGKDILQQSSGHAIEEFGQYLEHTRRMSDLLAGLISEQMLSSDVYDAWIQRFIIRLNTTPEVSSICFTNESLDTVYLMRYGRELELGLGKGHSNGSTMRSYEARLDGYVSAEPTRIYEYEPRTREWWKLGYESDQPHWTRPYQWFQGPGRQGESVLSLAYTRTVRDRAGNRLGVLSLDAALHQIDTFLERIARMPGEFIVVTDEQDRLIASSIEGVSGNLNTVPEMAAGSDGYRRIASLLSATEGGPDGFKEVRVDGKRYWAKRVPIAIEYGPSLMMTLAVPDDQLLQTVKQTINWMTVVGTLCLAMAAAIALLMARTVTRPLRSLAEFAREIGRGQFDRRIEAASTREFDELSQALNAMAANLQERVQLLAQKDAAQKASTLKSQLIAHVSHEFRTPLNAIIGYGELVKEAAAVSHDARAATDAGKILLASRHLLTLINNLLDISRIEAGKMHLDVVAFSIRSLISEVEAIFEPIVTASHNRFEVEVAILDDQMVSDPARIKQVLINLLGNAAKFTSNGEIRLRVEEDGATEVRFLVIDSGPGLSAERIDRLFEPFGHVEARGEKSGAGLGLAISRQLCQILNGNIRIDSELGKGTRAVITLPKIHRGSSEFALR